MTDRRISGALLVCVVVAGVIAQAQSDRTYQPDTITRGEPGKPLTGPAAGSPEDIALRYIRENRQDFGLTAADVQDLSITSAYTSEHIGVTHVYVRQRYREIGVVGADANVNVASDGSVISAGASFFANLTPAVNRTSASRGAVDAALAAARRAALPVTAPIDVLQAATGPAQQTVLSDGGIASEPITARLVYQPVSAREVRLAWQVDIDQRDGQHAWTMTVDAESNEVLGVQDRVDHDTWDVPVADDASRADAVVVPSSETTLLNGDGASYRVFALPKESPYHGSRTLEVEPAHAVASPFGWHDTDGLAGAESTRTFGNNAHAYTDLNADNVADPGSDPDGGLGLTFDYSLDLTLGSSTYRPAAVTNLFYWNNVVHDVTYGYGFNEAAGNFQTNNYANGGLGNDSVRAEAQDGSGLNNANFFTPADGNRPRMQMYIWVPPGTYYVTVNNGPAAGDYVAARANFGPQLSEMGPITGDVVLVDDGVIGAGTPPGSFTDGCEPFALPAGSIALVDRGFCNFTVKVINARAAGAVGVIVVNNVTGPPAILGGSDPAVSIPSVMIRLEDGNTLKANLPLNATLRFDGLNAPTRDSDLDAGVIVHEYGHGISNRLTGGPANVQCLNNTEQMGEGWSDWMALALTAKAGDTATRARGIGTYVSYQLADGRGIRPTPYSTDMAVNPSTYDTIKSASISVPHGLGYVWATMLWDMYWNLSGKHGFNPDVYGAWSTGGNNLAIQLVVDGMKLQVCSPGFVDGRNAILQADVALTGGANQCMIWKSFARRGLGFSASQGSSASRSDGTEAFDLPSSCRPTIDVAPASVASTQIPGVQATKPLVVSNSAAVDGDSLTWTITEATTSCATPADLPWVSASPLSGTTAPQGQSGVTVTFDSTGLPIGTRSGKLCFNSNDAATPVREAPVSITVIYDTSPFVPPIAAPPQLNPVLAGSAVPVKFSLGGDYGLSIFAAGFPASRPIDCTTLAPTGPFVPTRTSGGSTLSFDPVTGQYTYPWKTLNGWRNSCRELVVRLNDGTDHPALFSFQ